MCACVPSLSLRMLYWSLCCCIWDTCCVMVPSICSFWDVNADTCSFSWFISASWHRESETEVFISAYLLQALSVRGSNISTTFWLFFGMELNVVPVLWSALCTEWRYCHAAPVFFSLPPPSSPPHWTCARPSLSHLYYNTHTRYTHTHTISIFYIYHATPQIIKDPDICLSVHSSLLTCDSVY